MRVLTDRRCALQKSVRGGGWLERSCRDAVMVGAHGAYLNGWWNASPAFSPGTGNTSTPLMEAQFRRTLLVSNNDFSAFLDRPFAVALLLLALAALIVPATVGAVRRVRGLGGED
jgi:hypothetical protein